MPFLLIVAMCELLISVTFRIKKEVPHICVYGNFFPHLHQEDVSAGNLRFAFLSVAKHSTITPNTFALWKDRAVFLTISLSRTQTHSLLHFIALVRLTNELHHGRTVSYP